MAKSKEGETSEKRQRKGNNTVRTEQELASDLLDICEYRKKSYDWRRIARLLNAKNGLDLDFAVYYRQYQNASSNILKEALASKDELIADEIAGIDWQIEELTRAWENSIGTKQKVQTKITGKVRLIDEQEGEEVEAPANDMFVTEWEEHGDPRYMAEITKLRERRAKILGFDAAEKVEHSGQIAFQVPPGTKDTKSDTIE